MSPAGAPALSVPPPTVQPPHHEGLTSLRRKEITMTTLPADLTEHAARLLTGTNLTTHAAAAVAAGTAPSTGPIHVALRDGWVTSDTLRPLPSPTVEPSGGHIESALA